MQNNKDQMEQKGEQERGCEQSNLVVLQRMGRCLKMDNKVKIDSHKTEYMLIKSVAQELGWKSWSREQMKQEMNVIWFDTYVSEDQVKKLKPYQRINHFLNSTQLGRKNLLSLNLNRMKKLYPNQYDYFPATWFLPTEIQSFHKYASAQKDQYFIVKPCSESQGRGIYLTKNVQDISKDQLVVQSYIQNPLLIDKMKFDLRIYVLLKSLFPLKIYVFQEGLGRLATTEYEAASVLNSKNMRVHLTNYAINKLSPDYIFNKNIEEDGVGHKRSYSSIMQSLQSMGCDTKILQSKINKIIIKTILSSYSKLIQSYKSVRDIKEESESVCFEILGFDIMIQQDYTPLLIQVNHSPSFCTDTPLDLAIKKCLILDTFNLLNLKHQDKIAYLKHKANGDQNSPGIHIQRTYRFYDKNKACLQEEDTKLEGAYRKIYPMTDEMHQTDQNKAFQKHCEFVINEALIKNSIRTSLKRNSLFPSTASKQNNLEDHGELQFNPQTKNSARVKLQEGQSFNNIIQSYNLRVKKQRNRHVLDGNSKLKEQNDSKMWPNVNLENDKHDMFQYAGLQTTIPKRRQKQSTRSSLPMPLNSISIKFQDRNHQKYQRENLSAGRNIYLDRINKIHSFFKTFHQLDPKESKEKQKGNQFTNLKDTILQSPKKKKESIFETELKMKLEKMQLARIKLQRIKKLDKGGYIIISSKVIEKKNNYFPKSAGNVVE